MSMRRAAVLSALWAAGETWSLRSVSMVVFLVLARLVDPAAFGLVALAAVYVTTVTTLTDQGLATALIQRETIEQAHKDSAFWANLAVGIALALITLVIADPIAKLYGEPRLAPILRWFSLSPLLASGAIVQSCLLRRALRFRELALRQLAGAIAGGIAGIVMALAGMGVWALVAQSLVGLAVSVAVLWSVADWRPAFSFSMRHFRDLFSFGLNVLAANVVRAIGFQADRLVLGYFLGATELGYYSVAQRVLGIVTDFAAGSAERIVVPLFARIQGENERINRGLMTAQRVLSVITMPVFAGLVAVAPVLVPVALGQQWFPSIWLTQLLALASLGYCLSFFFGLVLTSLGRPGLRLGVVTSQALSQIVLTLIGVRFGATGVAIAMVFNQILFYVIELFVLRHHTKFSLAAYLLEGLVPALAAIAMALCVILLGHAMAGTRAIFLLVAQVLFGVGIYGGIILIFSRARFRELFDMVQGLRG